VRAMVGSISASIYIDKPQYKGYRCGVIEPRGLARNRRQPDLGRTGATDMTMTQLLALAQMQELERDMRARRQRHELAEARRMRPAARRKHPATRQIRPAARRLGHRIAAFAGAIGSRPSPASTCDATGTGC